MQNLAFLLLLAITASTLFAFDSSVFAQEADTPEAEVTDEEVPQETEVIEEETVADDTGVMEEETVTDDTEVMEDEMETTMEDVVISPRQQLLSGTDPHEIQCGSGLQLVFKAITFHPACVKESSYQVLLQRGWASDHNPSHEELTAMMDGLPKVEETESEDVEDTSDEEIVMEEDVDMEEESATGNGTEITPQSYAIELSEAMEMGAN